MGQIYDPRVYTLDIVCLVARDVRERDIVNNSFILKSSTEISYKYDWLYIYKYWYHGTTTPFPTTGH